MSTLKAVLSMAFMSKTVNRFSLHLLVLLFAKEQLWTLIKCTLKKSMPMYSSAVTVKLQSILPKYGNHLTIEFIFQRQPMSFAL